MKKNVMTSHMAQIAVRSALAFTVNFVIILTANATVNQAGKVQNVRKVNTFSYSLFSACFSFCVVYNFMHVLLTYLDGTRQQIYTSNKARRELHKGAVYGAKIL